jgi:hypothetical protein
MVTKPPTKSPTKAAFVRSLPMSTPAVEVVKKARAAGLKMQAKYVYNVRASAKVAAKKSSAPAPKAASMPAPQSKRSINAEELLKALGAELGLSHAIAILERERGRVRAVLGTD